MIYNCSIDGGNSAINIVVDGEKFPRIFPSIQSDPLPATASYNNAIYTRNMNEQLWNKLHVETILNKDSKDNFFRSEFLFGHMAEEFQKDLRSRSNTEKHKDKDLAKWMITALAYVLLETKMKREDYLIKQNDLLQFNVNLSTGLPFREGVDERKRQEWADIFQGTHRIEFKHPIFKGLVIDLVIENVMVLVEAELALNLELNKSNGIYQTTKADALLGKKMVVIDIGGYTTEIVTIAYELEQDESYDEHDIGTDLEIKVKPVTKAHLTDGIQRGIKTIMEEIIVEVTNNYRKETGKPLKNLTVRDIELAFTKKGIYNGKIGYILPERIHIKPLFDKQSQNLAMDIVQKTYSLFEGDTISEVDTIFLCGGGSRIESVTNTLKSKLSELGFDSDRIIPLVDPVFANAKGYYLALSYAVEDAAELVY